jgi:hypothetical protein
VPPHDVADIGAAPESAPREREYVPSPVIAAPRETPTPREPEVRSFDFDRPAASPPSPAREAAPTRAPVQEREPVPMATATAAEPREWTPTPPTDAATPRNEP